MTQPAQVEETPTHHCTLASLSPGSCGRLLRVTGDSALSRRLLSLGLRRGARICLLQRRGSGVVVECAGNRVALGESVARQLLLQPETETPPA